MDTMYILGAGFSYHVGLPMVNNIAEKFKPPFSDNILHFTSSESKWKDLASETDQHNGWYSGDRARLAIAMELLVEVYMEDKDWFNYEEFYQWLLDNYPSHEINNIWDRFCDKVKSKYQGIETDHDIFATGVVFGGKLISMFNHLIADLLYRRKDWDEVHPNYNKFLNDVKSKDCSILTLNHDTFLEALLDFHGIAHTDGFTDENSNLINDENERIDIFTNYFPENHLPIYKLHGSVNYYRYTHYDENGAIITPTEEFTAFKTNSYSTKHHPKRLNSSGEVVQYAHVDITPKFITGVRKVDMIKSDELYSLLISQAKDQITSVREIVIIGYGFMDKHVNELIELGISHGNIENITIVNPSKSLPLSDTIKAKVTKHLLDINEL